jgi:quinoprotein glucose dehydrogenase
MLKENGDRDPYIRHAGVVALANLASSFADGTIRVEPTADPAVRLAVVVAYRRLRQPKVGEFLADPDPRIVAEAARAVHDERIEGALAKLAELADKPGQPDAVSYRALSACFKLGTPEAAARVARFAARTAEAAHARVFALKLLADWANPPRRDHVTGLIHDLPKRPANIAADALKPVIAGAFSGPDAVRSEAARTAPKLGIKEVGPLMAALIKDPKAPVTARAEALHALAAIKDPATEEVTKFALTAPEPKLRAAGLTVRAKAVPAEVLKELPALLKDEAVSLPEKQAALAALGEMKDTPDSDKLLGEWLDAVAAGKARGELVLDVLEAAEKQGSAGLKEKADQYRAAREKAADGPKGDKLAPWSETLAGGDAEKGRDIFLNNAAVYCQRCHRLDGQGGDVGPQMNGLAAEPGKDRRYLLESIVLPTAQIAKGYETVVLVLADGRTVSGVLKADDKKQVRLMTAEATELVVPADDIESRRTGPSAMPDDLHKKLTRRELRDVVEFLASLKEPAKKGGP